MTRVPRLARAAWTTAGFAFAITIGSAAAILLVNVDARAQVNPQEHLLSFYDTMAPGVNSNVQERFCVVNKSPYGDFDPEYWQSEISTWLNDPLGWEAIGTGKVDFISSCDSGTTPDERCQTVHVCIEFWDFGAGPCPGAGGCAGPSSQPTGSIDGHAHRTSKFIAIPVDPWWNDWLCQGATCELDEWDRKQRVINHEMGHVMGQSGGEHAGPEFGVAGGGNGPWDGDWLYNPTPGEIDRFRAHYDGEPARPVAPCVGFPQDDRVLVSWIDAAEDETNNNVDLYRIPAEQFPAFSMESGAAPGFGSRVTSVSAPRSDVTSPGNVVGWFAQPKVSGGPRGIVNSNPIAALGITGLDWPSRPCTLKLEATGPLGQIQLTWVDASYDETEFAVYYQYPDRPDGWQTLDDNGWTWAGTLPAGTEAFADSAADNQFLEYGKRVCAKVVALKSAQVSFDSNYACVTIPSDWDGDGFPDDEDWCPGTATQSPGAPGDSDCDGYPDTVQAGSRAPESFIGTDPARHCAATPDANDELPDSWPPDHDDNQLIDLGDVLKYNLPMGAIGPDPPYSQRLDLNADNIIDLGDVLHYNLIWELSCVP